MGPQDLHLGIDGEQGAHGTGAGVDVEHDIPRHGEGDDAPDRRAPGVVFIEQVEFADAPVYAAAQALLDVGHDAGGAGPVARIHVAVVGAQDRHDAVLVVAIEAKRAVVRGAGDQGPRHPRRVQCLENAARTVGAPRLPAVVHMGVEDGQFFGGRGGRLPERDHHQSQARGKRCPAIHSRVPPVAFPVGPPAQQVRCRAATTFFVGSD